jgi:hypothetical protein
MRRWFYFLPWILFLIAFFVFIKISLGAYTPVIEQTTGGTNYVFTTTGRPSLCQTLATSTGFTLSKARIELKWLDAPITYHIRANITDGCGGAIIATSTNDIDTATLTNAFTAQDFYFPGIDLDASTTYGLFLYTPDGYPTGFGTRIMANGIENYVSDTYTSGNLYQCDPATPTTCSSISNPPTFWGDLKFSMYSGNINNIAFKIPTNATTTADFDYWFFQYNYADGIEIGSPGEPDIGRIVVSYGLSTSTLNKIDSHYLFLWASSTAIIAKSNTLIPGLWYANAVLYSSSSVIVASSTISFTLLDFESLYPVIPTSTEITSTSTCASSEGLFTKGFCYILNFLFVPSQNSVNRYTNLIGYIEKKPPMGYFTEIKSALTGFTTSTTSTFALADISSIPNSPVGTLKNALVWLLWFAFGFWLFHRLRHLQL